MATLVCPFNYWTKIKYFRPFSQNMSKANVSSVSISSEHSSQPTDQPVSNLDDETSEHCTDHSSVNRAILLSLNRLNENFASSTQHSYEDEFAESG